MGILELLLAAYAVPAAAAGVMTWREQRRQRAAGGIALRAAGLAACALWPAMLALVLVLRHRQGPGTA